MVVGLRPTAYGVFVDLSRYVGPDAGSSWYFFDRSGVRDLPAGVIAPAAPVVSADGRHAAWMELDGPRRPAGRIAQLVVTDLSTGRVVLRDHHGMGGGSGDDLAELYEELPPTVDGFVDGWVYWTDATGSGRHWRTRLIDGQREHVPDYSEPGQSGPELPLRLLGARGTVEGGRFQTSADGGEVAYLSPSRRWTLVPRPNETLQLWDARGHQRVRPGFGGRHVRFVGWTGPYRLAALVTRQSRSDWDPGHDRRPARLVRCILPDGSCTLVVRVTGPDSVATLGSGDF